MPMHAERDIVLANPSVSPSVRPSHSVLYLNERTSSDSFFHRPIRGMTLVCFERYRRYIIPKRTSSGVSYTVFHKKRLIIKGPTTP